MLFNEAERTIFGPYFNGEKMVFADPLAVHRKLHYMLGGEPNKYLQDAKSDDLNVKYNAKQRLFEAAVYALDMIPFNRETGTGALEQDVKAALKAYLEFMEKKGSRGPNLPTSSLPSPVLPAGGSLIMAPRMMANGLPPHLTMAPTLPYGPISEEPGSKKPGS